MWQPLVSVIIPAHNAAKFIVEAIVSVATQSYTQWEIIVVDDGSTDATASMVQKLPYPITLIQQSNQGISGARNAGLAQAKGELVAFLDADDVWLPTKLAKQVAYLDQHPTTEIVFSLAQNSYDPHHNSQNTLPIIRAHVPPNCLFRASLLQKIGVFDEKFKLGEFADWYGRIVNAGMEMGIVEELLVLRRIHGENMGIKNQHQQIEYVRILKRKLDQQKTLGRRSTN